jgi:hypothetical protein
MSVQQLVSHFGECRRRLSELHGRHDYVALSCTILRVEGTAGIALCDRPFLRIFGSRPFYDNGATLSWGENFALAFYPLGSDVDARQIPAALSRVNAITGEILPLLGRIPDAVRERLQLPESDNWWRIAFHLAWHFPRPFLGATRQRLLATDGAINSFADETFVQMHGTAGRTDLLPGLIFSDLKHDLCTSSEAAVGVIMEALECHAQTEPRDPSAPQSLSPDQRRAFDRLRHDFLAGTASPMPSVECKLLKLANSFETPPATEWAELKVGGCLWHFELLSRLNDLQEIVQIRGPATNWYCEVAERAGNALPACIPDSPVMFDDIHGGTSRPVMDRGPLARWLGFVFTTLKQHQPEALQIHWETPMRALAHGLGTLDRDLFAASVLAIDLAGLTTAAKESADRECTTCSPFSVPSMEEQGFEWVEDGPPLPPPREKYTVGLLIQDLRLFGESYHQYAELIRQHSPVAQKGMRGQLAAIISQSRNSLQAIPGFNDLRALAKSMWDEEISFVIGQRIVDALVERSNGRMSPSDVEGLTLLEAVSLLSAPATQTAGAAATANGPVADVPEGMQRVVLRGRDEGPIVLGKEKQVLTDREYNVVKALLDAGDRGLTKDKLDDKSGHSESRKVLKALRNADEDWAAVIQMPGKAGRGGYRIK